MVLICRRERLWNGDVTVKRLEGFVRRKLVRKNILRILAVWSFKADRQMEGLIRTTAIKKLNGLVPHLGSQMLTLLLFDVTFKVLTLPGKAAIEIQDRIRLLWIANTPFANKARPITSLMETADVRVRNLLLTEIVAKTPDTMTCCVLPSQHASSASHTNRGCDKRIIKGDTLASQCVQIGRLDNRVAIASQCIEPLIVSHQIDDVRAVCRYSLRWNQQHGNERQANQQEDCPNDEHVSKGDHRTGTVFWFRSASV